MLAGCSSANVTKNPGPDDTGIRYWRPKPYLLVTPADPTGRLVKLELQYLPDYNEEYSIHPKGRKPPAVALQDGWNLVAVGGPAPPPAKPEAAAPPPAADMKLPEYVVASSNIPIGFYESVFDTAGQGKYLKGWRYVGWSVWGGGPPTGVDAAATAAQAHYGPGMPPQGVGASAVQGALYGIVFFNGAMTFRQIDEIAGNMTCPQYAKTIPDPAPVPQPLPGATTPAPVMPKPAVETPNSPALPRTSSLNKKSSAFGRDSSVITTTKTGTSKTSAAKTSTSKTPTSKTSTSTSTSSMSTSISSGKSTTATQTKAPAPRSWSDAPMTTDAILNSLTPAPLSK
jgi:hypothetical protein